MEQFTAKAVFDLYLLLSDKEKDVFLRLVGQISTAEVPVRLVAELSIPEQFRFSETLNSELASQFFPLMLKEARRIARETASISDEEFDRNLDAKVKELAEGQAAIIAELERAQLKEQRDAKPRNTERDAEIVRLARQGKTSGEIRRTIKTRWECTVGAVNQVIIRAKRDGLLST